MNLSHKQLPSVSKRKTPFDYLFNPASIAVIGASNDKLKPGGRVFSSLKDYGYAGALWPVNPKSVHIAG